MDLVTAMKRASKSVFLHRLSYRGKLFVTIFSVFLVFTVVLVVFQHQREVNYRRDALENRLRAYADIYAEILKNNSKDSMRFKQLHTIIPQKLRLTVINRKGRVLYESVAERGAMGNHLNRPEVKKALSGGEGLDIRYSETERSWYLYLAKSYGADIVRVSLPYDTSVKNLLKADNIFIWFVLLLVPFVLFILISISDHFGKAISMLRFFVSSAERGLVDYDHITFPHSELGDVARMVLDKYKKLDESNRQTACERERLLLHFLYFEQGIAIFSPKRDLVYANPHFLQYVNLLFDHPTADVNAIWNLKAFHPVEEFLRMNSDQSKLSNENTPIFRFIETFSNLIISVQTLIYKDGGFEITLTNVTQAEREKELKQKMSNNITHELRTPVSSVRGYIETILANPQMDVARKLYFLQKADAQAERLTNLIRDVALITKVDEAPKSLPTEPVNLAGIFADIVEELQEKISLHNVLVEKRLPENLILNGNYTLLYSIFRNLLENSLKYAGDNTVIRLECYRQDDNFCFLDYYDTGKGVPEEHLSHIFERFYRVQEGRTREDGGTGLGLSIVRNAVQFHGGEITARNRKQGGLEFLFTLKL